MITPPPPTAPVIPFPVPQTGKPSERKWGKAVMDYGYTMLPSILLQAPQRLGLSPTQLAIVVVLAEFWWDSNKNPWPSKATICNRLGLKPRQLQRHIAEMEKAGLITRSQRYVAGRKHTNEYDFSGLVKKLKALAPEFQKAKQNAKAVREQVNVPAGRRASTKPPS